MSGPPRARAAHGSPAGRAAPHGGLVRRLRTVLDALVPPACVLCARGLAPGRPPLCGLCAHRLPALPPPRCPRCGAPGGRVPTACPECEGWSDDHPPCAAPYAMREGAAELVRALKYGRWEALAGPMGRAMVPAARRLAGRAAPGRRLVLVPVPLSAARLRERGFNQAELLAASLGAAAGWPVAPLLARRSGGRRQARLGRRGRATNVRGLFLVPPPALDGQAARAVLLVDDVVTTGATGAACAAALARAGSSPVGMVSFARALHALEAP